MSRVVAPARYRILDGPRAGQTISEAETWECSEGFDGCDGSGTISVSYHGGDVLGLDSIAYGEAPCPVCGGLGRVYVVVVEVSQLETVSSPNDGPPRAA